MKKAFTIFAVLIMLAYIFQTSQAIAQAPHKMSYQAVIRNPANGLVTSTTVGLQISILKNSPTGTPVYIETLTTSTNANGLVSVEIGGETGFDTINWANGTYFLKTETDPTGGTDYTITGTSQLLSVPYALHSKTSESLTGGITETDPVFETSIAHGITGSDTTYWNNKLDNEIDGSVTNELQVLSISHDTVFLTNGGFVKLPASFDGQYSSLTGAPTNVSLFANDAGYLTSFTETDPVFIASPAGVITSGNINNWNTAYGWGNHATAGYLTSFTETDPLFAASPANGISNTNIGNWNTAYGWGNHASAGYLTSFTETDPLWTAASGNYYTELNMQTPGEAQVHFDNITNKPTSLSGYGITDAVVSNTAITAGTGTKITFDEKGLITAGANLATTDIPDLSGTYLPIDGGTMTGNLNADGTANLSGFNAAFTVNTTSTYTLAASDNGKVVGLYNASAITLYIPDDLPVGFNCLIMQTGVGKITFTATGSTTLKNRYNFTSTSGRYAIATLIKIGGVLYVTSGDME